MELASVETFDRDDLLARIRQTHLMGFGGAQPYLDASIELRTVAPDDLAPAQRYVLTGVVAKVLEVRSALLAHSIDPFALDGSVRFATVDEPDELIPIIPPIVEESVEPDGRRVLLVNDGLHRVWAARSLGLPITVVEIHGVPTEYPYYALALPGGWADVTPLDELPDGFQKKEYRIPTEYKALFRDFNAQFPGVQQQRTQTNPDHLQA